MHVASELQEPSKSSEDRFTKSWLSHRTCSVMHACIKSSALYFYAWCCDHCKRAACMQRWAKPHPFNSRVAATAVAIATKQAHTSQKPRTWLSSKAVPATTGDAAAIWSSACFCSAAPLAPEAQLRPAWWGLQRHSSANLGSPPPSPETAFPPPPRRNRQPSGFIRIEKYSFKA